MGMSALAEIRKLVNQGERRSAQRELARLLKSDPANRDAWLLLAGLIEDPARKADCYRHVLEIDPGNKTAQKALEWLYTQPALGMALPEAIHTQPLAETPDELSKVETITGLPLFDLTSFEPTFTARPPAPPEEVLIPLAESPVPHKRVRAKWILIPLGGLLLLAVVAFGVWQWVSRKPSNPNPIPQIISTENVVAVEITKPQTTATPSKSKTVQITAPATNLAMRIVWAASGKLVLWDEGQISTLTKTDYSTSRVALSSDGEFIAFNRSAGIWVIGIHSANNERLLVRPVALPKDDLPDTSGTRSPAQFIWLPGTHNLLFNTDYTPYTSAIHPANDLFIASYDMSSVSLLLPSGQGGEIFPAPDGRVIAVISPTQIQIFDLKIRKIIQTFDYGPVISNSGNTYIPIPSWDSQSTSIFVAMPPQDSVSHPNDPVRIWQIPVDGSQPEMLAEFHTLGGSAYISPDLQHVAYILNTSSRNDGAGEWHVASLDGSQDTILLQNKVGIFFGWSTDGSAAAFGVSADPPEIWLYNSATRKTQLLETGSASGASLTRFAWVDGKTFLMTTRTESTSRLWLGSISTRPILVVEDPTGADIPFAGMPLP